MNPMKYVYKCKYVFYEEKFHNKRVDNLKYYLEAKVEKIVILIKEIRSYHLKKILNDKSLFFDSGVHIPLKYVSNE